MSIKNTLKTLQSRLSALGLKYHVSSRFESFGHRTEIVEASLKQYGYEASWHSLKPEGREESYVIFTPEGFLFFVQTRPSGPESDAVSGLYADDLSQTLKNFSTQLFDEYDPSPSIGIHLDSRVTANKVFTLLSDLGDVDYKLHSAGSMKWVSIGYHIDLFVKA